MKHKIRKLAAVFLALCLVVQTLVPSVFAMDSSGSERIENTDSRVVLVQNEGEDWPLWETMSYTRQPGATAEVSFEGTGLALYGQKAANGPILSVTIDGVPMEDADFYAPSTTGSEELVWQVEGLEDGAHQAVFTFTDRANPSAAPIQSAMQAAIDYFVVTSEETQPELPAGQQSRVEDTDAAMSFDDTWAPYGNIHYTGTVGATMSFTFTGNAVELYGDVNYTGLTFDVSIDGQPAGTADTYVPSYAAETKIYSASGLQEGEHRLTLTYTGENNNPEAHGVLQGSVDYALVWAQEQPDLIRYEKDYEDGQPGEWEGARAEVVEDPDQPGNHVLKVSNFEAGEAGRYFARDASAPAIKDGTLSMRVKAEHPTSSVYFQFGFIYRAEDAVKEANQFTQSGAWYVCNEGSYNVGYTHFNERTFSYTHYATNRLELTDSYYNLFYNNLESGEQYTIDRFWNSDKDPRFDPDREGYIPGGVLSPERHTWNGEMQVGYTGTDTGCPYTTRVNASAAEHAMGMFERYKYTGDLEYLEQKAYPFMRAVGIYLLNFLQYDEETGTYYSEGSNALEQYWNVTNPINDLVAFRALFQRLIEASETLGRDEDLRAMWQDRLENLAEPVTGLLLTSSDVDNPMQLKAEIKVMVEPVGGADRQALADRVRQAQQFLQNSERYQAQTVTALQQATEKAQAILADQTAAEETVMAAEKQLQLCVFGLRYRT